MKILYTIFTTSHGNGGHFYSLSTTARALATKLDVVIVNIGFNQSPVIENSGLRTYNILLNNMGIIEAYKQFKTIVLNEKPEACHSFCTLSYFFSRAYSLFHPMKVVLTKCGGPNPKRYFPYTQDLVLYSKENLDYFSTKKKFQSTNLHLIPNRVLEPKSDPSRIKELSNLISIPNETKVFLRIGRISSHYRSSILQAVELNRDLNKNGYNSILILLGTIQDKDVYDEFEAIKSENLVLISDSKYTRNASELIEIANFVIGTGRSLMEAASKNKILLTPNNKTRYPVLVDEINLESLLSTNFSPRNSIIQNDRATFNKIINLFTHGEENKKLEDISSNFFNDHFDISGKIDHYINLYENIKFQRNRLSLDYIIHIVFVQKYVRKFNRR